MRPLIRRRFRPARPRARNRPTRRQTGDTWTTTNSTTEALGRTNTRTVRRWLLGPLRAIQSRVRRTRVTRVRSAELRRDAELDASAPAARGGWTECCGAGGGVTSGTGGRATFGATGGAWLGGGGWGPGGGFGAGGAGGAGGKSGRVGTEMVGGGGNGGSPAPAEETQPARSPRASRTIFVPRGRRALTTV